MTKKITFILMLGWTTMAVAADWSVSPTGKTMARSGGTFTLQTHINDCESSLELVVSSDEDWLSIADIPGYLALGDGVKVSVLANGSNKIHGRTGTINVNGYLLGQTHNYQNWKGRRTCDVFQYGVGASFSQDYVCLPGTNAMVSIDVFVKSGVSWTMTAPDWITILGGAGTGNGTITIIAPENDTGDIRSGVIQIHDAGGDPSIPYSADNTYCITLSQGLPPEKYALIYENTRGANNSNPLYYYKGASITFDELTSVIDGYIFSGWSPAQINESDSGDKVITASWAPINYTIAYDANGGMGEMESASVTYDAEFSIASNAFTWINHRFIGWATNISGGVVYAVGESVSNLTSVADNVVTLYAVWEDFLEPPIFSPATGTTFEDRLSISISCESDEAVIHYTTNGANPTVESPIYRRFRIENKTTVKAIAVLNDLVSDISVAEYAKGHCTDPEISPIDGSTFEHSGQEVCISWVATDGTLHYTMDGSEPTLASPIYDGAFLINESTVVKARVFSDTLFDSAVVTANLERVWLPVAIPRVDAATSFVGSKTKVALSCATAGAIIRYTLNGNDPNSHSTKYTGPFYITDTCVIKAYATMSDYHDSQIATQSIVKVWGIGDAMGKPDHAFTTAGTNGQGWYSEDDVTAPNGKAMRSGAITHNQTSKLSTIVVGPGVLSFSWKASCEEDPDFEWDHAEFKVDGEVVRRLCGETLWQSESIQISGYGEHSIEWWYIKDDVESNGADAVWVAGYDWVSSYTATQTSSIPVPYTWLAAYDPEIVDEFDIYESAANAISPGVDGQGKFWPKGSPVYVWQDYLVGGDPYKTNDIFTAFISMESGKPVITWLPNLNTNGYKRTYVIWGKTNLTDKVWHSPTNSSSRFFKVEVLLP